MLSMKSKSKFLAFSSVPPVITLCSCDLETSAVDGSVSVASATVWGVWFPIMVLLMDCLA